MPEICKACSHPDVREIDSALVGPGVNIAGVSRRFGLGWDGRGLRRHAEAHLDENLRSAARTSEDTHAAELLARLVELADDAANIRRDSTGRTAVAAVAAERGVLETILVRLGVDNTKIVEELKIGRELRGIVVAAARRDPVIAEALAVEAARRGQADAVAAFRELGAVAANSAPSVITTLENTK